MASAYEMYTLGSMAPASRLIDMSADTDYEGISMVQILGSGGGDVSITTVADITVIFSAVPAGCYLNVRAKRFNSSGTTATQVVGYVA